jgi:hypothetical protein
MENQRFVDVLAWCAIALLTLIIVAPSAWADHYHDDDDDDDDDAIPFDVHEVYFELNDTDGDLGIHALIDGGPWKELEIEGFGREQLEVELKSRLKRQGLTEFFFESAEPPFDELSPERFFRRFPEATVEISGKTLDGQELESETELTHLIPSRPEYIRINEEKASDDCDAEVPSVYLPVVISWEPVMFSHPDLGRTNEEIKVVLYELVVEAEDEEPPLVLKVELAPEDGERLAFEVPDDFLESGGEFKFEIVTREASHNQTAFESCFEIENGEDDEDDE